MSRQIGLRDIHIAIVTSDDSTETIYDIPIKLERAISAKYHQNKILIIFIQMILLRI